MEWCWEMVWSTTAIKYKGRVVLRGDVVKEDSGSYALRIEQGSSASHMTAAKVLDVIARLPDRAGEARGAASAYSRVKIEDAPDLLRLPKSECPTVWIRLTRSRCSKSWDKLDDPLVPLGRN